MSAAIAGSEVAITVESMFSMNRATATMSGTRRSLVIGAMGLFRAAPQRQGYRIWRAAGTIGARRSPHPGAQARVSRQGYLAHVLGDLVPLLDRRPVGDRRVPSLHVGILVHVDRLPFEARDPRPDGDVGDGVVVGHELAPGEAPV